METKTRKINPKTGPAWTERRTWKIKTESYPDWQWVECTLAELFRDHARNNQRGGGNCGVPYWFSPADGSTGQDRVFQWLKHGDNGIRLGRFDGDCGIMDGCTVAWCD